MSASSLTDRITAAWLGRGPLAIALLPLAGLYGALSALRRLLYRLGWLQHIRLPVPVIVVGNRVAGGAGKTPTTIAVVQHLLTQGLRVGVVSRGHGRESADVRLLDERCTAAEVGDEPLLIWRRTGGVPLAVGRDRAAAAQALLATHPDTQLIVCDDGLQHWRLARDIEIIVFDERGAGNGWLLPAGPLREPISTPGMAPRSLTLYNATAPSTPLAGHLAQRTMRGACRLADWWQGHPAQPWAAVQSAVQSAAKPPDTAIDWLAVAGIAVPQRFFDQLRAAGLAHRPLALHDHFDFATIPWPASERLIIVTEKDAIKLPPDRVARERPGCDVWVAALDFSPEPAFWTAFDAAVQAATAART
ncbi:tetraacyldisaccharide 4'-kinase [Aquabacterium sp.]|uniref:tetraacyldisaccharide 4'-kinase n=1 Tax=Aquabacterium sp. TaxID=1872578 RepID=UPI0035ADAD07